METKVKCTTIIYDNLLVRVFKGKYGEYKYRSPRYGYKWAYKYNQMAYIYLDGKFDDGYFDVALFKHKSKARIVEWLKEYKETSRKYKKAVSK